MRARITRRVLWRVILAAVLGPFALVGVMAVFTPLPPELRETAPGSLRVLARNGKLLREVRADDGTRARPLPIAAYPKPVLDAVLAAEDRRFYGHVGVDPVAVVRAFVGNVVHRRVTSGASTITMQLARTVRPHRKSLWGKLTEMALAVRIEASLSKEQVLEQYLNRVIYGPNLRGYAAASQAYFGAGPESLSLAEAALVAGLPRGPSLYALGKRPDLAKRRRDRVLARMADAGSIDTAAEERAVAEPVVAAIDRPAFGAPHFVRGLVTGALTSWQPALAAQLGDAAARAGLSEVHTTIDPDLQRAAEGAVTTTLATLADKHVTAAAVVVLENATGDVLAWVGSPGFYDQASLGQNDGVVALRQPGSSLKPFVYAEAMTRLGYTPATVLPDVEIHIPLPGGGDYVPHDYDAKQRGPVRLREALGNSLNIPAVDTIRNVGSQRVLDRLHAFGFSSLTADAEHYGPALALGDGEVTLLELANAYAGLARGGAMRPVRMVTRILRGGDTAAFEPGEAPRAIDERVAAMLTDILADKNARMSAFGDQNVLELDVEVAAKTGTSKGYRDNVAVGYTREVTVAVWAGNFDGSPMQEVSGISGAGPIFRSVMTAAVGSRPPAAPHRALFSTEDAARLGLTRAAVCSLSGEAPTSSCPHTVREWLPEGTLDHAPPCSTHVALRVTLLDGLRAGPGCGGRQTTTRVFERWSPPYDEWAKRVGRPVAPEASSPECPITEDTGAAEGAGASARITYPFDGARFVIDPDRPLDLQVLDIQAEPSSTDVQVDGKALPKSRTWPLVEGAHTISVPGASPVHITVRR